MHVCIDSMYVRKVLARKETGTVLISVIPEAGTVESLWKSPQQLLWLFAGYLTQLWTLPSIPVSLSFSSTPLLVQVSGAAKEALGGTHPDSPSWQRPLC